MHKQQMMESRPKAAEALDEPHRSWAPARVRGVRKSEPMQWPYLQSSPPSLFEKIRSFGTSAHAFHSPIVTSPADEATVADPSDHCGMQMATTTSTKITTTNFKHKSPAAVRHLFPSHVINMMAAGSLLLSPGSEMGGLR